MTTETVLTDEQREDLYLAYLEPDMPGDEGDAIIKTIEQAVLQSPEVKRLREDAEQYRWLKERGVISFPQSRAWMAIRIVHPMPAGDISIDAAISAAREQP